MDEILATLQTLTLDELNKIKTETTSQIHMKEYFISTEHDEILSQKFKKLVSDGVITVVQVSEDEDIYLCFEDGKCVNIKLRIVGLQDLVELRHIMHQTKYTYTEHRRIILEGKIYEFGIGDEYECYNKECGCTSDSSTRDCHAEYIYVLRKLHTKLNIDDDDTAKMLHLLFGCWSYYPFIEDEIQSLEKLIQMWE